MNLLGKKVKATKGLSVIILELHVHTGTVFLDLCLREGCVDNLLVILKQKRGVSVGSSPPPLMSLSLTPTTPQQPPKQTPLPSFTFHVIFQ